MLPLTDIIAIVFIGAFLVVYVNQKRKLQAKRIEKKLAVQQELAKVLHSPEHKVKGNYE